MYTHTTGKGRWKWAWLLPLLLLGACSRSPEIPVEDVASFGSNPGGLRMLEYLPASLEIRRRSPTDNGMDAQRADLENAAPPSPGAPLVVALHGCTQDAAGYGFDSGWIALAHRLGFILLLPEQRSRNNLLRCFNWYSPEDNRRDRGELLSIRQMIERMTQDYAVDPQRIFVTGLSAGAAMTLALASAYPEVFAGAAPVAGVPYGCAEGLLSALDCMDDPPDQGPQEWAAKVRSAAGEKEPKRWPTLSVWQGAADSAVDPANAEAIVRQWAGLHGIDTVADRTEESNGDLHRTFQNAQGADLVESHQILGMSHGLPVDPGPGADQCGKAGRFYPDVGLCSSLEIARFWGLSQDGRGKR